MVAVQFNPFAPEVHANPYPMYRALRESDPVHWSELMEAWVLTRYEDVQFVLRDPRFSSDRRQGRSRFARLAQERMETQQSPFSQANTMLTSDPPEHTRLRGLVSKAFTPRRVEELRPRIQDIVDAILDKAKQQGAMDVIWDLGYPLPVIVIAEMLGVAIERRDDFKRWSDDIVATLGGPLVSDDVLQRALKSSMEMAQHFREVIAERRSEPRDDLLSALVAAEERGDVLSEEELLATCVLLLAAGNETTTNLIGNGMLALLRNPDQMARLRRHPELVNSAVEEFLRYDGPVHGTGRVAMEPLEIAGHSIEKGGMVFTLIGAANRDPAQFDHPDSLDIAREPNPHLSFGFGIHYCLGAPLARIEAQIAFRSLIDRFDEIRPVNDDVEWGGTFILRGLKGLPVTL